MLRKSDGRYGLAKARGTLFKLGGLSSGWSSTSSTRKRDPLGRNLYLESGVWPSLEDKYITIDDVCPDSQTLGPLKWVGGLLI